MSQPINTVNGPLLIARQTAEGTPATSGFKKFHMTTGKVATKKEMAKIDWIDSSRFADSFDYVDSLEVAGQFTVKGSADAIAALSAYVLGVDVITGGAVPYTHTINPDANASLPFLTIQTELGSGEGQAREHSDCLVSSIKIESSSDNKVLLAEVTVVGIEPGKVKASLASATTETEDPFLHYDAEDTIVVAGINSGNETKDVSQVAITISNEIAPYYGDSVTPTTLVVQKGEIAVDFTVLASDESVSLLNEYYYGTASPATNSKPTTNVFKDTFSINYSKGTSTAARSLGISIPELVYVVEDYPETSADGSPIEIACTGTARIATGDTVVDIVTITADTADATSYSDGTSPGS
jgi:hypothetical protein